MSNRQTDRRGREAWDEFNHAKKELAAAITRDQRLSPGERLIGRRMLDHITSPDGYYGKGCEPLMDETGCDRRTIQRAQAKLARLGYFEREVSKGGRRSRSGWVEWTSHYPALEEADALLARVRRLFPDAAAEKLRQRCHGIDKTMTGESQFRAETMTASPPKTMKLSKRYETLKQGPSVDGPPTISLSLRCDDKAIQRLNGLIAKAHDAGIDLSGLCAETMAHDIAERHRHLHDGLMDLIGAVA